VPSPRSKIVDCGAPLERLLAAVDDHRADMLVLGARAISGVERALLASQTER
jgi:nucleotide-binding universal stress UspA family protein